MLSAWYALANRGYQENGNRENIYLEIYVQGNMVGVEQLIDWHYSDPKSAEKASLLNHLIETWESLSSGKLHGILDELLTIKPGAQCIIYFTMRNRRELEKRIDPNQEDSMKGLKQFLKHLKEQGKNPFLEDASVKAMQRHPKYSNKRNFMTALQIERVRRIRATARPDNFHRQFCHLILDSLDVEECQDKFTAIQLSAAGLKGAIALQKALTFAGTANHTLTIKMVNDAEKHFNEAKSNLHPGLWDLLIWWVYEIKSRIFSRWLILEKHKTWKKHLNNVSENCTDSAKKKYMDNLRDTGDSFVGDDTLMSVVVKGKSDETDNGKNDIDSSQVHVRLHMAHVLLSKYIIADPQPGATFRKKQIENMLGMEINDRTEKALLNKLLMSAILRGGRKAKDDHRPEPLIYDPHSFDSKEQLKNKFGDGNLGPFRQHSRIKRMYACCSSAQFLIQSAQERNQSWLPLQISLVLVDLVVKIKYLAGFAEKMAKKKDFRNPISDADAVNIYQGIVAGFREGEKSLRSFEYAQESPLYQWILNIAKRLQEMPLQNVKIETITQICQKVVCVSDGTNSQGGINLHHLRISEDGMFERGKTKPVEYCSVYYDNKWTPYAKTPGEGKFRA